MQQKIRDLINQLIQDYDKKKQPAAAALKKIGKDAVPVFIQLLQDPNREIRLNVVRRLQTLRSKAIDAVPALIDRLQDSDILVRVHVPMALCRIAEGDAVDVVIPMLQDSSAFVRARTIEALEELGPDAKNADIHLIHLLKDPDDRVRKNAEWALEKINTPDARRALRYE